MTSPLQRVLDALYRLGCRPRHVRGEQWRARCPGPCHRNGDKKPSLGVKGLPDKVIFNCFVCGRAGKPEILQALGLVPSDLFPPSSMQAEPPKRQRRRRVEAYRYEDINGHLLAEKVRYEPKNFKWRSPRPDGRFDWKKADGVTLYRLPHLIDAPIALVAEGEKAADRLTPLGFVVTCPPTGSNVWDESYTD